MGHHYHPLETCLARIFVDGGTGQFIPSGTGVTLYGGRVLTCAHVVLTALGLPAKSKNKPEQIISLDFPLSGSTQTVKARVEFWDALADLAELKLIDPLPEEVEPTYLHILDDLDHKVKAFGFPGKNSLGEWSECKLRGKNTVGWIEMFDPLLTGNFVQQGFSGGPVWDDISGCCIGIVVAVDTHVNARVGYLIPTDKIAECWDEAPIKKIRYQKTKRELPSLLLYRMNRTTQEDNLAELYRRYKSTDRSLPMVAIMHGEYEQAPDKLLERLGEDFIPRLLRTKSKVYRFPVKWPPVRNINDLGVILTHRVADAVLHVPDASMEEIQKTLAAYNTPVMIELEVLTDDWHQHRKGILDAFLDFWNNWPALAPNQKLFVFLYVTHKIPESSWILRQLYLWRKKQIFLQLEQCSFHHYTRILGSVFSELMNISENDTRTWARTDAKDFIDGDLTILLAKIRTLFDNKQSIPMEVLASELRSFLISSSGD